MFDETHQHLLKHLRNFSWVVENTLAGVAYPASEEALEALKGLGVKALLSLSEQALSPSLLAKVELEAVHIPIEDFTAPTLSQIEQAMETIQGFLAKTSPVAVHCHAGQGRTGTILACYLVSQGLSAEEAITRIRLKRPGSIETLAQEQSVSLYEECRSRPVSTPVEKGILFP